MRRRRPSLLLVPFALAILVGAGATAVAAGGMAVITVTDARRSARGRGDDHRLNGHQHGVTPVSWPDLTVIATDAATDTVSASRPEPKGPTGTYVATMTFPASGEWTLTFDSTDLMMEG